MWQSMGYLQISAGYVTIHRSAGISENIWSVNELNCIVSKWRPSGTYYEDQEPSQQKACILAPETRRWCSSIARTRCVWSRGVASESSHRSIPRLQSEWVTNCKKRRYHCRNCRDFTVSQQNERCWRIQVYMRTEHVLWTRYLSKGSLVSCRKYSHPRASGSASIEAW